jgi:iron complex outermembrane receptor protein
MITGGGGTTERAFGGGRFGGSVGSATYRGSFHAADHDQLENANGSGAGDGSSSEQGSFRIDRSGKKDTWTIEANLFRSSASVIPTTFSFSAQPSLAAAKIDSLAADITGVWRRRIGDAAELRIQSYYDYADRPQPQATAVATQTWDNEVQFDFLLAKRHNFSVGAGEQLIGAHVATVATSLGSYVFNPADTTYANANSFVQDEIHFLDDHLLFTAGAKVEHNHLGGWAAEPSANLVWILNKHHSLWTSAARAVRTPNLYERSVSAPVATVPGSAQTGNLPGLLELYGAPSLGNELVNDYEAGYRAELTRRLSLDISLFYDRDSKIRSIFPGLPYPVFGGPTPYLSYPIYFGEGVQAVGKGAETALSWQVFRDWKLAGSYTYNATNSWISAGEPFGTFDGSDAKPTHTKFKLQSYWNPTKSLQLDSFLYWTSQADGVSASSLALDVPPYWHLDVRLGYRINPHWQLSLSGQNLLQARHLEGVPELLSIYSYVTRGAYLKSTWQF